MRPKHYKKISRHVVLTPCRLYYNASWDLMEQLYRRSHFVNNLVLIGAEGVVLLSSILSAFTQLSLGCASHRPTFWFLTAPSACSLSSNKSTSHGGARRL